MMDQIESAMEDKWKCIAMFVNFKATLDTSSEDEKKSGRKSQIVPANSCSITYQAFWNVGIQRSITNFSIFRTKHNNMRCTSPVRYAIHKRRNFS